MITLWFLFLLAVGKNITIAEKVFIRNGWFEWLYEPTREELQRGVAVPVPSSWAHQARKEKSARIVALGNMPSCKTNIVNLNQVISSFYQVAAIPQMANMLDLWMLS